MTTLAQRDAAELERGFTAWCARRWPDARYVVTEFVRPRSGWTNETLLVTLTERGRDDATARRRVVVRLPPAVPTWPVYDLRAQALVLTELGPSVIPVPQVVAFETDDAWLGTPFLVMSYEVGRPGAEAPALDPWVTEAPVAVQRRMHEEFVDVLAALHRFEWNAGHLAGALRGGEDALAREVEWWKEYVDWASDGAPPPTLAAAIAWCVATAPRDSPPPSLCWGDARVGNLLFDDDHRVACVLDWEMATIGPAEMDLAWYLALDDLTTFFVGQTVPGFLPRAELVTRYETALGRAVVDLEWHEIFALVRSTAINDRQARLARESGISYPGVAGERNPVLRVITGRIDAFEARP